ncbi:hypothetical protein I6I58_00845 [Campylobacter lari]|uniref:hypothetical protein n=1 Tax=Campylobacter lari TaxID=201 RepID=UPI001919939E|nr:hypothetical protein [Campylobacter lari]QQT72019.1 hypothetical protein I6I58_00845 [Campylobacter lari]
MIKSNTKRPKIDLLNSLVQILGEKQAIFIYGLIIGFLLGRFFTKAQNKTQITTFQSTCNAILRVKIPITLVYKDGIEQAPKCDFLRKDGICAKTKVTCLYLRTFDVKNETKNK